MTIPKVFFQTWKTKELSPVLQSFVDSWKHHNPSYTFHLYDDESCEKFLEQNFPQRIVDAYKNVIPGAFKADLWRYCVLYIHGGVYSDIDTICKGSLDTFLHEGVDFVTPIDLNDNNEGREWYLFNSFIAATPKHPILLQCISRVVANIEFKHIPSCRMDFAGPGILGQEVNTYLNKPPLTPFPGRAGTHGTLYLLQFHKEHQFIKDIEGNILFQNKSGDRTFEQLYENECRNAGIVSWVHSPQIFKV
jgi:mannosyltransferase OCH1-like enzyme